MPVTPTYPGVYIEEIPSGVRTIAGVATSITAFVGRALRGAVNEPVRIQSFADFERTFGGLWVRSTMSYAVQQFFLNGGSDAIIVRVVCDDASKATLALAGPGGALELEAASEGNWGNSLKAIVDHETRDLLPDEAADSLFNMTIRDDSTGGTESVRNVSTDDEHRRFVKRVLEEESSLVRVATDLVPGQRPTAHPEPSDGDPFENPAYHTPAEIGSGSDGSPLDDDAIKGSEEGKTGLYALEDADLFNLLCLPPLTRQPPQDIGPLTYDKALAYCRRRRAMLLVDPPNAWSQVSDVTDLATGVGSLGLTDKNAAIFFPRVKFADPLKENRLEEFVPCGAVAGIMARTDAHRGVWKAPAGLDATLSGVRGLSVKLTDGQNGQLNPLGVNCLRNFPIVGNVLWGSRTLEGADRLGSEWKYIPVRRLALYIEESLYRGTQWVVFEPNDEPLWAQIRLNVGAFMQNLFRQGAFQGTTPREAYFVKCDKETTTQNDINLGIVNILVGFAPLKPAEFVIIKIQQIAGQIQT
jgi:phage tail sheath protein FI